jgi:GNAT superfamily N-acetyltransferase
MKITIRKGVKEDLPGLLELIKELASYENAGDEVKIRIKDLEKDGFGVQPLFQFIIAKKNNYLLGMSFYFVRYSTWKGKILYLEDFVVKKEYRGLGIGALLFEEMINICVKEKFKGMAWQVLEWNLPAINFYKKYNSDISSTWLDGKLTEEQIHTFHYKK